ncbi:hypothetical protein C8J57DRAFT_207179 [Mycena rebaudengoi]|nr:hypothetical protein C8J57DRAFT_207179 [Mycena rebaudengoi]
MTIDSIETTDINSKPLSDWEAKGLFLKKLRSELICSVPMYVIGTHAQSLSSSGLFIPYISADLTSMDDRSCPTSRRHSSVESKIFLRYERYSFQEVSLDALRSYRTHVANLNPSSAMKCGSLAHSFITTPKRASIPLRDASTFLTCALGVL